MANYKINRNSPEPSDEQINKSKDFQKILTTHQQVTQYKSATKPLFKNPGFMGFIVLLSIVVLTFVITENDKNKKSSKTDASSIKTNPINIGNKKDSSSVADTTKTSIVSTKKINDTKGDISYNPFYEYASHSIDASKGGIIYEGSTRILIPAFAFSDAEGNILKEEVELKYKEFRNPVEIAFANIPMKYDSANTKQQLISAGMFEIKGYHKNKEVTLKEPIQVELVTNKHNNYNSYYLNHTTNNWEFVSKEKKSVRFLITGNESSFPEMIPFNEVVWEFAYDKSQKNPDNLNLIFSKQWSEFIIESELQAKFPTNVKLKRNSSEAKFQVMPVALSANPLLNEQLIQVKYKQYKEGIKKRQKDEALIKKAMQEQDAWLKSVEGQQYIQWLKSPTGQQQSLAMHITSVFTINKFGIWNCDTPDKLPSGAQVTATFKDFNGNDLKLDNIKLVDYNKNSVYNYYLGNPIKFNPKSENILWAVLPGSKLAVFPKEKFKSIPTSGNVNFNMEIINISGKSKDEINQLLGMKDHITSKEIEREKNLKVNYDRKISLTPYSGETFYSDSTSAINSNGFKKIGPWQIESEDAKKKAMEELKKKRTY